MAGCRFFVSQEKTMEKGAACKSTGSEKLWQFRDEPERRLKMKWHSNGGRGESVC